MTITHIRLQRGKQVSQQVGHTFPIIMSVLMNDGVYKPIEIKKNPITEDFVVSRQVLGLGINGKVVECTNKTTGFKYALKVGCCF